MAAFSLFDRITKDGTLSEPKGVPDPTFALPSTVNWMRALRVLVDDTAISFQTARKFYSGTGKRAFSRNEENSIFEQLLFAVHQLSALEALNSASRKADVARVGIVTWYYGVYAAASAMVTAQDGSFQDDHTGTATVWDRQIASRGLVMNPFALRVSSLVRVDADVELQSLKAKGNNFVLTSLPPANPADAYGACCAYLSGTVNWWRWRAEEDLKTSREFKALGVKDFRTKPARGLRDSRLSSRSVAFLHQASRYRGKANYREALFLGYGPGIEPMLASYVDDLAKVLAGFATAAGAFCSKRLGSPLWDDFVGNLESKRSFTFSPSAIWI